MELRRREEIRTFNEQQESAFIHQKFSRIIITKLKPILADIIRQGVREGSIQCSFPEETAQIVLTVLTITLDNHLIPLTTKRSAVFCLPLPRCRKRAWESPPTPSGF